MVAEELNFTKASQRLFISQPPLSRQVKELENEIGTELFIRNNKRVELTDAGKYFKQKIETQLEELEAALLETKKIGENLSGEYRIGYISSTFSSTITELVQFLMKKYPYLNIKLYEASTAKQKAALEQSKLDLGVVRAPIISTKVDLKLWFKDSFSLVYNNQIIKQHVSDLKDLQNEVFVFFNKDYAPTYHSLLLQICSYHGFVPNLVHESNNINSIIQLVRNGLGISIVPSSIVHNHAYTELSFMELGGEYTTEVLIATPKNNESVITKVASEYLLS